MNIITYSDIGKRKLNEDVILVKELHPNTIFAIIADGMGGYESGDKAAKLIVENIEIYLRSLNTNVYLRNDIEKAIHNSNQILKQFNEHYNIKSGATIAGAIITERQTIVFWVGDVQIDLLKNNESVFKSEPHTLIQDMKKYLKLVSSEMIKKYKHIVTKSISGKMETIDFGYYELKSHKFDQLIISSDGVHNCIDPSQLVFQYVDELNIFLKEYASDNNSYILIQK